MASGVLYYTSDSVTTLLGGAVLSEDGDGFVHFLVQQRRIGFEVEHGEQLGILNLEQHSRDFTRQFGMHRLDIFRYNHPEARKKRSPLWLT